MVQKSADNNAESIEQLRARCDRYEAWFHAIDEYANFDIWFKDTQSRYQYVNQQFEEVMGRSRDELLGKLPSELFDTERAQRVILMDQKIMKDGLMDRTIPCDDSGILQMHEEKRFAVRDRDGKVVGLGCFAFEVTDRSLAEEALDQAQSIAKLGNWRWSIQNACLISCSDEFASLLGCSTSQAFDLMYDRLNRIVHPDDHHILEPLINNLRPAECQAYQIEYRIIRQDGSVRYVLEIAEPLIGNSGVAVEYVGTLQDITDYKMIEEELRRSKTDLEKKVQERTEHLHYMASHDDLTGLLNRYSFNQRITDHLNSRPNGSVNMAMLLIDLNKFKEINDCYGHAVGDEVLKIVAQRLRKAVKKADVVARFGGDEFSIAAFGLTRPKQQAIEICQRIDQNVNKKIKVGALELTVGCCSGVHLLNTANIDLDDAIKCADMALYKAKQFREQKHIFFKESMREELTYRKTLEQDLHKAIKNGEIYIVYQSQISLQDNKLLGFEALARWKHVIYGNIPPDKFIPIAEDCGLINELGDYIIEKSCSEFVELKKLYGDNICLAINLSVMQFQNPELVPTLKKVIEKFQLSPQSLEVEVTESLFIKNLKDTRRTLDDIRAMGLKVALDDFGTGYSALSYLKQFEIDTIKLDRSFIRDIITSPSDQRIVEGIIKLAASLGLSVVSEGVETAQQKDFLASVDCQIAQGYYYGHPESLEVLAKNNKIL
ncbi:MAG: diguanylate cyclase (GGDEF)-like protein/PAS domain S-box-containing protein [Candidatus Endobugula sp.]|jgi:diguanylate cyclase (GGDEF)-like protein/PAS domain S-box-containing protein